MAWSQKFRLTPVQERNELGKWEGGTKRNEWGHNFPGAESLRGAPKSPENVTSTFFDLVHLLQKDLRFDHGGAIYLVTPCTGLQDQILLNYTRIENAHKARKQTFNFCYV